jgi:hypothetical protein
MCRGLNDLPERSLGAGTGDDQAAVERLLVNGLDDILSAAEIIHVARTDRTEPEQVSLDRAIRVTAHLISHGLARPGDAPADFVAWSCTADEAIERIEPDWRSRADPFVGPGEIVWLDLTPAGEEAAREAVARHRG